MAPVSGPPRWGRRGRLLPRQQRLRIRCQLLACPCLTRVEHLGLQSPNLLPCRDPASPYCATRRRGDTEIGGGMVLAASPCLPLPVSMCPLVSASPSRGRPRDARRV